MRARSATYQDCGAHSASFIRRPRTLWMIHVHVNKHVMIVYPLPHLHTSASCRFVVWPGHLLQRFLPDDLGDQDEPHSSGEGRWEHPLWGNWQRRVRLLHFQRTAHAILEKPRDVSVWGQMLVSLLRLSVSWAPHSVWPSLSLLLSFFCSSLSVLWSLP